MPLQNKHSRAAGHVPNLIPGEVGVNLQDGLVFLRADGRKVSLDVAAIAARAAPADGIDGSPLSRHDAGVIWDAQLAPSSLVADRIDVDAPPGAGWSVPGLWGASKTAPTDFSHNDVLVEPFYVASDAVDLSALACFVNDVSPDAEMRVGIIDAAGAVVVQRPIFAVQGLNSVGIGVTLTTGAYTALLWIPSDIHLVGVSGARLEQGWDFDIDNAPVFVNARTISQDMGGGIDAPAGAVTQITSAAPLETHFVLMQWSVPT